MRRTAEDRPPAAEDHVTLLRPDARAPSDGRGRPQNARGLAARLDGIPDVGNWTDENARAWWETHLPAGAVL